MRRLYVMLASAVIATTLIVVATGVSASPAIRDFLAVAYSRSLHESDKPPAYFRTGTTLANAKFDALHACRKAGNTHFPNQYRLDCEGIAWVRDGWMGFATENLQGSPIPPGYEPKYGWAIDRNRNRAKGRALNYCYVPQMHSANCEIELLEPTQTAQTPPSNFDGGSWNTPIH